MLQGKPKDQNLARPYEFLIRTKGFYKNPELNKSTRVLSIYRIMTKKFLLGTYLHPDFSCTL